VEHSSLPAAQPTLAVRAKNTFRPDPLNPADRTGLHGLWPGNLRRRASADHWHVIIVLSFISQLSASHRDSRSPTPASLPPSDIPRSEHSKANSTRNSAPTPTPLKLPDSLRTSPATAPTSPTHGENNDPSPAAIDSASSSPIGRARDGSRPSSMVYTYQPPLMDIDKETIPELQPVFAFLNSHTNKLYQEGYFLKLDDQDIKGNPNPDRTWTECFAQLVGTVLSLWDAAELDAAGDDGEVLPKFINLTDASIKMIESLPTRSNDEQPLQNILSISTAGRNRYLLHFNSHHSLIQWTSGIRLAMFEHSTLQEAYTGALIAGKGKLLNNINIIMERARVPVQEWVRVRFGAGVPWRRCWCVIDPPNEKEYQKAQKDLKKRSPYDRSHAPVMKGEIRFYDSKKEAEKKKKHAHPIATITDAYSAYSIYPQSKALIEGSTLLKVEGQITIHSDPPSATEGFVFIMPEVPPAVSGFEMLLRFLFPTWDVFGLYGRPGRLVASTLDPRSLMFGMPKHRRYGYLEILDVSGLILTEGSTGWSERDWRKKLKDVTSQRMTAVEEGDSSTHSRSASRSSKRLSFGPQNPPPPRARVGFADDSAVRTGRPLSVTQPGLRTDSAPPDHNRERASPAAIGQPRHARNVSDTQLGGIPPFLGMDGQGAMQSAMRNQQNAKGFSSDLASTPERLSSEDESMSRGRQEPLGVMRRMETPEPVNAPPAFSHNASSRPQQQPYHSPDLRKATSRLSNATLTQLATAGGVSPEAFRDSSERQGEWRTGSTPEQADPRGPAL
jgi:CCR4-NOT transcriptional complex subunit CAF120